MLPFRWPGLGLIALCVVSCTGVPTAHQPGKPAAEQTARPPRSAIEYRIDSAHSELRVLVYRAGPLAALGHNHVMVDKALAGWVGVANAMQKSSFYLQLAPADFLVDDPEARAQEGADFADAVSAEARSDTHQNMLGEAQLDAERFPLISVQSLDLRGTEPSLTATMKVTVAGRSSTITAPFTLQREPDRLRVTAAFDLRQSELALTPLSVMLGALRVEDEIRLKLNIVATAH